MRKRDLIIDTQFSQLDSSEIQPNQQSSFNLPQTNQSYDLKQQDIFNYMLLDLYYQGLQKVETFMEKNQKNLIQACFNRLKIKNNDITHSNMHNSGHYNNIQFRTSPYQRRMMSSGIGKEREQSDSVDKMNLLNNIADRIIETKRIKSQSKHNNQISISQQDGKKIMSKLDKLEKMIKSIKRQNQMSHQGSVIYVDRYPQRYHGEFYNEGMTNRGLQEWGIGTRRRVQTPVRTPYHMPHYNQPYSAPMQRHYEQHPRYINQPMGDYHNRYIQPIPQYQEQTRIIHNTSPSYGQNPSYAPVQRSFKEDQMLMSKRNNIPNNTRVPNKTHRYLQDGNDNSYEQESDNRERNSINQEVRNIKQQLHQLKKMNTEYINKNTIMMDEARSKERKYTYQDQLPQRNNEFIKRQYPIQRKQSLQRPMAPHPTVSPIQFRNNRQQFTQREIRNIYQQPFQQSDHYNDPNHYYPNGEYIHDNYRHQQYRRDVVYPTQQYITPVNVKPHHKQRLQTYNDTCRQHREREHGGYRQQYPMKGGLYNNRYQ